MVKWLSVLTVVLLSGTILIGRGGTPSLAAEGRSGKQDKEAIEKFLKSFGEPIQIGQAKPVTVKDAQFVLVSQTNWKPAKPDKDFPMVAPIDIQLHITNQGKGELLFPTFGTFGIRIFNADGKEVKSRTEGKGDNATRPVILPGGASYALCRQAELRYDEKARAAELIYCDGTGVKSLVGPLEPGQYKLVFWYTVAPDKQEKQKDGDPPMWVGEVVTNEVPIQVLDEFTKGRVTGEQRLRPFTEPVRIRESKPVTVNNARFIAVAARDWKPGNGNFPIDVQLHITNLSKSNVLFPTFDTFDVYLKDEQGKPVMLTAGVRSATTITPPLLLPDGVTYAICRKAELQCNANAPACEFLYGEGTANELGFGPLPPGRYQLGFAYAVARTAPMKDVVRPETKKGEPATWHGTSVTEPVLVEVLPRE